VTAHRSLRGGRCHDRTPRHDGAVHVLLGSGQGQPSDAELIERSWGEPEAFAVLFDRYAADIHHYAARRLGTGDADDLVAETFLAAFRRRTSYDTARTRTRPWLYGIATTLIARQRRSEQRLYRALARTGVDPLPEPMAEVVVRWVAAQQQQRLLAAALAGLAGRPACAAAGGVGGPRLGGLLEQHPQRLGAQPGAGLNQRRFGRDAPGPPRLARVGCGCQLFGPSHAACAYSWISPPSRSRRTTLPAGTATADSTDPSGGAWPKARCGRWTL